MIDPTASTMWFLNGGGEMGARMRSHEWAATPFGPPDVWSETLRTMVSVVLNSALLGTILWGPELRLLYNDAYAPALAERHPAALGRPIADAWGPVWDQIAPQFLQVLETGEPIFERSFPITIERNGRNDLTYWNYSVSPVRDPEGRIVGLLNQAIEVTGEIRAERERAIAEATLRDVNQTLEQQVAERTQERDRLWRNTQDLQIVIDTNGAIKAINPAFTETLGWTINDAVGKNVFDFIVPDDNASQGALEYVRGQKLPTFENRYRHKNGGFRWLSWVATPAEELIYASGRHITAEKEQAQALRQAEEALRQSQRWKP